MSISDFLTGQPRNKRVLAELAGTTWPCAVCGEVWRSRAARSTHEIKKHPEAWAAGLRELRADERIDAAGRRYRAAHPDRIAVRMRRWRDANRDRISVYVRRRHAAKRDQRNQESRAYKQTALGKAAMARAHAKEKANGSALARLAVRKAVVRGTIRKLPCHCGDNNVEAHHSMGYEPQHWLTVTWLCRAHHEDAHHRSAA